MNLEMRFRPGDDVRAVWLLVLAILLVGSYYVQTRYQSAISVANERTETLYRRTMANTRLVHEAAHLRAVERQAEADLMRVSRNVSLSQTTADLLTTLHNSAQTFHTRIVELQPGTTTIENGTLESTVLTIRTIGKFRNVLQFVEDLSHHATLISVSDTEMSLTNGGEKNAAEPHLSATIHAVLYRLQIKAAKETRIASAR